MSQPVSMIIKEPNYPQFTSPILDSPLKTESFLNSQHYYSPSSSQSRSPVIRRKMNLKRVSPVWKVGSMKSIRLKRIEENRKKRRGELKVTKFKVYAENNKGGRKGEKSELIEECDSREKESEIGDKENGDEVKEKEMKDYNDGEFGVESSLTLNLKNYSSEENNIQKEKGLIVQNKFKNEHLEEEVSLIQEEGSFDMKKKINLGKLEPKINLQNLKNRFSNVEITERSKEDTESLTNLKEKETIKKVGSKSEILQSKGTLPQNILDIQTTTKKNIYEGEIKIKINNLLYYIGQTKNKLFHGNGRIITNKEQEIYKGEFSEGKYEGKGTLYNLLKKTEISEIQLKPEIKSLFIDLRCNNYKEGYRPDRGILNINFEDENWEYYEGHFYNGKKSGIGKLVLSDGRVYNGEFLNGVAHGYGILKYFGESVAGIWKRNIMVQLL